MGDICINTRYINGDMVFIFLLYPNRCIYCDSGCIHSGFLEMDSEEQEGECDILYSVAHPLCIVNSDVLEVGTGIL